MANLMDQLIAEMRRRGDEEDARTSVLPEARADDLRERFARFSDEHIFDIGDLVTQKPGLECYRWPEKGQPAIVTRFLHDGERRDGERRDEAASNIYLPADIVIGVITPDGEFTEYAVDSARFMPWPLPEKEG